MISTLVLVNLQGRSLLSISVSYLDDSIELTRVLINHGARVWPDQSLGPCPRTVEDITRDSEESSFTWFLRAVINQRGLSNSEGTLSCLCHVMGHQPDRMKSHVLRVMLRYLNIVTFTYPLVVIVCLDIDFIAIRAFVIMIK